MTGFQETLLPPTSFDVSDLTLTANKAFVFIVAQRVDLTAAKSATLAVRVHALTLSGGDTLTIDAFPHGQTIDDPAANFTNNPSVLVGGAVGLASSPAFLTAQLQLSFGGLVGVRLTATRNLGTTLSARLSLDVYLKAGGALRGSVFREKTIFHGYGIRLLDDPGVALEQDAASFLAGPPALFRGG